MERLPLRRMLVSLVLAVTPWVVAGTVADAAVASGTSTAYTPIALGSQANWPMANTYVNPPQGSVTLGGIPFTMGNMAILNLGQQVSVTASAHKPLAVYLLLNSANSMVQFQGQTLGHVRVAFTDGSVLDTPLVLGSNIREWRVGAGSGFVTTATSPSDAPVWTGTATAAAGGGAAVIDMLSLTLPATTASLTGVTVSNSAPSAALQLLLSGITVSYDPILRPGNSWATPAAWRSQAPAHAKSATFTGVSPAQAGNRKTHTYLVVRGDTLTGIARKQHVSLQALLRANRQIKDKNKIYVGQPITIPN